MDILRKINQGGEHKQKVYDYLSRFLPTETIEKFMIAASGYIAIPIKFDSYQTWREGEQNEEIAIWSRVLQNIILSSSSDCKFSLGDLAGQLAKYSVDPHFAMKLISLIFDNYSPARLAGFYRGNHFDSTYQSTNSREGTYFGLFENLHKLNSADRSNLDFDIDFHRSYTVEFKDSEELRQVFKDCNRIAGLVKTSYDPFDSMTDDLEESDSLQTKKAGDTKVKLVKIPGDILSMMTDNAIRYFCEGGTFVLNALSSAGYDYANVDGETLNFYSIKPPKCDSKLTTAQVLDTMAFCERVLRALKQRMPHLDIEKWRLIINSLRPVDVSKELLPNNVIIMDPEQCLSMLPPTIANRVALDCNSDPESIIDKCESEYLKMAREREDELRACRQ